MARPARTPNACNEPTGQVGRSDSGRIPRVLSIAGSDSGGGAGIQADLKAFAACGVHGMTAITAITAQNTLGVRAVHPVPVDVIAEQVRAVRDDIGIDAVKIGMLGDAETVRAVVASLDELGTDVPVILDPVMVSESGAELLDPAARAAVAELLVPRATVITPNLPEARALAAATSATAPKPHTPADLTTEAKTEDAEVRDLALRLHDLGARYVLLTGGHRERAVDLLYDGAQFIEIAGERHPGGAGHGSGCTHSSVLAARLAWGDDMPSAARRAKELASKAVRDGLREIGAGAGPVNVLGLGVRHDPPHAAPIPANSSAAPHSV